jgi:hypothetical protein
MTDCHSQTQLHQAGVVLRAIQEILEKLGEFGFGRSLSSAWFDAEHWMPSPKSNAVL